VSFPRAHEALSAARVLLESRFAADAVSRAYYATYHAASAAVESVGGEPKSHAGLLRLFGELVVVPGLLPSEFGVILHRLQAARARADYVGEIGSDAAESAVRDATRFVEAVENWVNTSGEQ